MADIPSMVTDEDRAIARRWLQEGQINVDQMGRAAVLVAIRQEFSAALAAEREECAKVAGHVEKLQRAINRAGALASQKASHDMIIEALSDIPR